MTIDASTIRDIAHLARIGLREGEDAVYAAEVSGILTWIAQLGEVDTAQVAPLASVSDTVLRWRDDVVTDGNKQADILANAPQTAHGCFAVPKVIE